MKVEIDQSFELLTNNEWNQYLSITIFENMLISIDLFEKYKNQMFHYPILEEMIKAHNNKIGELKITYALCRHYYDKGIPDEPWYISPGSNGESVQYFPRFEEEHWMRRYWFNHFSESLYLKIFSAWDSVVGIINVFYEINESMADYRFRSKVMKKLKSEDLKMYDYLSSILEDDVYVTANSFRTDFVHSFAPSTVTNVFSLDNTKKEMEFPEYHHGVIKMVKIEVEKQLTFGVGNYTYVRDVMENIELFAKYSGDKINAIIQLMTRDGE
ncbi:hypothetical protein JDW15_01210 [Aerococcaceae bacterium zg-ZJ1578]|uniref:Cthe_2314 family HEPN domain-containing protein n=1 Tax=Aerococcaceae bacterium zg-252 TaxID=2796928 RepID=UPI001A2E1904|nr:hypothetical protein [Aerococcaceae bacterium zg-1578]